MRKCHDNSHDSALDFDQSSRNTYSLSSQGSRGRKRYSLRTVASEHTATHSRGEPTFINLDSAYPNQIFTVLVWGEDRSNVGALPRTGSHICATGTIQDYRGVLETVVRTSGQLSR